MKMAKIKQAFQLKPYSLKQQKLVSWWADGSPHQDKEMIIAEGAIRSGKTIAMIDSYMTWSLETFRHQNFIIAGKSMGALKRNVLEPLFAILRSKGITYNYNRSDNFIEVGSNTYYCFGANNEASQDVLQGLTAAGAYADEVALMPKSFVDQMIGRCSVEGRRYFMNCNPAGPYHWFKEEFIDKAKEKAAYLLHFVMDDNLTLSEKVKESFKRMFSGVFYMRYILGLWVQAEGVIYDMFDRSVHIVETVARKYKEFYVSVDYGTKNPTAFGLWGRVGDTWYKVKEYHYDGRKQDKQKTATRYSDDLRAWLPVGLNPDVIVDPSATAFIAQLEEDGFYVIRGNNDVANGILNVGIALAKRFVLYNDVCVETFREFESYVWDEKAAKRGEDKPIKQNDHHMDADRYFINTIMFGPGSWYSAQNAYA